MSKIVVSIYEPTVERAIDAVLALPTGVDMVELRADRFEPHRPLDCSPVRAVTDAEIIFTRRTCGNDRQRDWDEMDRGVSCGANWVDVEFHPKLARGRFGRVAERAILSYPGFAGAPEPAPVFEA